MLSPAPRALPASSSLDVSPLLKPMVAVAPVPRQIKIVDLGLSRFFEERKLMRTICGTHKYLAPELVQCDRGQLQGYDKAIDMWGVGLLAFIMLHGFNPFARESQRETHNAIMRVECVATP